MLFLNKIDNTFYLSIILFCFFLFFSEILYAQQTPVKRCPDKKLSKEYTKGLNNAIQRWMKEKGPNHAHKRGARGEVKYTVPIVIHIIHNGEAIGTGANLSDEQIIKQIASTNGDFLGDNNWTDTDARFKSIVGFAGIKFELAKQDPLGRATTGINRVNGNKSQWSSDEENTFMSLSYWPPKDYINVTVLNLLESDGTFALSTFPIYKLDGMSASGIGTPQKFEGIYIDNNFFGTNKDGGSYDLEADLDLGKTLTHELGHYFGLLHPWGDGSCNTDDYVTDTPLKYKATEGDCSTEKTSCGSVDMIQNFMDYTNDSCLTAFTLGQVARMQSVISNAHNRKSLLTSHGLDNPISTANKLSLVSAYVTSSCSSTYSYNFKVVNTGTAMVNAFRLSLSNNGTQLLSKDYSSINISPNQTMTMEPIPVTLDAGKNTLTLSVITVNGSTVNATPGSTFTTENYNSPEGSLPFLVENANSITHWGKVGSWATKSLSYRTGDNPVLYADMSSTPYANYELHSKSFNFKSNDTVTISFDWAYYSNSAALTDKLSVWVVSCENILLTKRIFIQYEQEMITMASGTPSKDDDWVSLSKKIPDSFNGKRVKVIIVGQNNNAGKLYIENLKVQGIDPNVVINNIHALNDNKNAKSVPKIYPNPVIDSYLYLELNKDNNTTKVIEIVDNLGMVIRTYNSEKDIDRINIFVGDLKKGLYALRIIEDNTIKNDNSHSIRFIKL